MRADQSLVARGLAASRTQAQRMIEAGRVSVGGHPVRKPSEAVPDDAPVAVAPDDDDRWVSRGALKLAGALAHSGVDPAGLVCLDVGQSTGGFTDCLLQAGAARVVGIDVGHGQLHPRLAADPRVVALESINARALTGATLGAHLPAGGFALIVVDASFISLTRLLPALAGVAAPGGRLLALVKPQFEVGPQGLDARGIVRSEALYGPVRDAIIQAATGAGWRCIDFFDSPIRGGDGNREFFLHASHEDPSELRVLPA